MYSVVLMAALATTTADAPSFGWRGCHGGWGGCHGGWGWRGGCYGCNGGWGCYGGGCYGSHGCYGGWGGCYGGCYGGACNGYGVFYGGCLGGCSGGCYGIRSHGGTVAPPVNPSGPPPEKIQKPSELKKEGSTAKGAKLIVDLPPETKLFIDDRPMKITSQHPVFITPDLEAGKTYFYEVRVEAMHDGKLVSDKKRVLLHAGDTLQESFASLGTMTTDKVAADMKK